MTLGAGDDGTGGAPPKGVPVRVSKGAPRGRDGRAVAAAGAALVMALAVLGVVARRDDGRSAADALAATRAAMAAATGFRFTVHTLRAGDTLNGRRAVRVSDQGEWTHGVWRVTGAGHETLVGADGEVFGRPATGYGGTWDAHGRVDGDARVADVLAIGRQVDRLGRVAHPAGVEPATVRSLADRAAVDAATLLYLTGDGVPALTGDGWGWDVEPGAHPLVRLGGEPTTFLHAITDLAPPELDGDVLRATVPAPGDAVEAFGRPLPEGRYELHLGDGDLPTALVLDVATGEARSTVEVRFTDWNEPIVIAPPGDHVDRTPWVDEDELAASDVAPVILPDLLSDDGFRARSIPARLHYGNGPVDCDVLELSDGPLRHVGTFLVPGRAGEPIRWLVQTSRRCALALDAAPFDAGGPGGHPFRRGENGTLQVLVGDTVTEVGVLGPGGDPPDQDTLDRLVAALVPVDRAELVAAATPEPQGWTPYESTA